MATTDAAPASAAGTRNHRVARTSRRNFHTHACQAPRTTSRVPMATMPSNDRWIRFGSGGRSSGGTLSQPVTSVSGEKPTRIESREKARQDRVEVRDADAEVPLPVPIDAAEPLGDAPPRGVHQLHRRKLDR